MAASVGEGIAAGGEKWQLVKGMSGPKLCLYHWMGIGGRPYYFATDAVGEADGVPAGRELVL